MCLYNMFQLTYYNNLMKNLVLNVKLFDPKNTILLTFIELELKKIENCKCL